MKTFSFFVSVFFVFIFISGLFVLVSSSVLASDLVEGSWGLKASMQQARGGLGVVAVDGKVYAIGGKTSGGGFVGTNECYDPKADVWVVLEPMPTSRAYFAIVVFEDKIYCIGGVGGDGVCGVTEVYDTVLGGWSSRASLPVLGGGLQGGVVGGKIFVLVGCDLFMYDSGVDVWVQRSSVFGGSLVGSNFVALAVVDDSLMVVGNFTSSGSFSELRVRLYSSEFDVWREGAKPGFNAIGGAVGLTSGVYAPKRVYLFGTTTVVTPYYSVFSETYLDLKPFARVYDPVKNVWLTAEASVNRVDFGVAVVDDVLYVVWGV